MNFAYADPPYVGQAKRHYAGDPSGIVAAEVDHAELVARLCRDYDSWALSLSSPSLQYILSLCPADVRVGAWVKPFASFKKGVNPAYAWEPVLYWHPRQRGREVDTVRDLVSANITLETGTHGAKPLQFCYWLFELMGLDRGDHFTDLYPGSGSVTHAWCTWQSPASMATLPLFSQERA